MIGMLLIPRDPSYGRVSDTIESSLRAAGLQPLRSESIRPGDSFAAQATDILREADVVIADITRKNPNIMYELGFAHALGKPTFLLLSADESENVPSDLRGFNMITYTPADLRPLRERLTRVLRDFRSRKEE